MSKRRLLTPQRQLNQLRGQRKILALVALLPRAPQTRAEIAADKAKRYPEPEIFEVSQLPDDDPLQLD